MSPRQHWHPPFHPLVNISHLPSFCWCDKMILYEILNSMPYDQFTVWQNILHLENNRAFEIAINNEYICLSEQMQKYPSYVFFFCCQPFPLFALLVVTTCFTSCPSFPVSFHMIKERFLSSTWFVLISQCPRASTEISQSRLHFDLKIKA